MRKRMVFCCGCMVNNKVTSRYSLPSGQVCRTFAMHDAAVCIGGDSQNTRGNYLACPCTLHTLYLPSSNPLACATYPLLPHVSLCCVCACVYVTLQTLDLNSCGRVLLFSCPWHVKFVVQEALMRPLVWQNTVGVVGQKHYRWQHSSRL